MTDDWSSCSSTCGDGVQTRNVFCKQEISPSLTVTVDDGACTSPPPTNLERSRSCRGPPCPGSMLRASWVTGSWSECSSRCGMGTMTRTVHCPSGDCPDNTRPVSQSSCDNGPCRGDIPIKSSYWLTTEWSHECSVSCGTGIQTRKVYCSDSNCDVRYRPDIYRTCSSDRQCRGQWYSGPWSQCSETCGMGKQTRDIVCLAKVGDQLVQTADSNCVILDKPTAEQQCHVRRCEPQWYVAEWAQCSHSCGSGVQRRECLCLDEQQQRSNLCRMEGKPLSHRPCHVQHCSSHTNWRPVNEVSRAYESSSYRNRTYSMDTNGLNVVESGCSDKYHNCRMVVQARLCKYKYYSSSCCQACTHRHN
uniref:PLAC domain-containing protein n=1 Tax=Clastoptera arizonana TaxID=38151 RepID=A0A1B6DFF5_9HEMI